MDIVYFLVGDISTPTQRLLGVSLDTSPTSSAESVDSDSNNKPDIDLEALDHWKKTPLQNALECGHVDIVRILESAIRQSKFKKSAQ